MQFMRDDEALKTISLFEEASETRGISRRALKNWVVNIFIHMHYKDMKSFFLFSGILRYMS